MLSANRTAPWEGEGTSLALEMTKIFPGSVVTMKVSPNFGVAGWSFVVQFLDELVSYAQHICPSASIVAEPR